MKKILLLFLVLIAYVSVHADDHIKKNLLKNKNIYQANFFNKANGSENTVPVKVYKAKNLKAPVGEVIGTTTYDLQTNSGMCRRIATNTAGNFIYAGWTMGRDYGGATERGTGFNFYNSGNGKWGSMPTQRIEPDLRVGWPSIGFSNGRQFSITHTGEQGMSFTYRTGNQNDWEQIIVGDIVNDTDAVWARVATEMDNIYVVMSRPPSGDFAAPPFGNILGGLNFIRSLDNGDTWESVGSLEKDYSNSYPGAMSADDYQIDASDGVIAIVYGSNLSEMILYKSNNQGDTWSKNKVYTTSNPLVEDINDDPEGVDFTVDAYHSTDGGNSVIIDSEGLVHVVYSSYIGFNPFDNDAVSDGTSFRLDWISALFYWNENMTEPQIIGKTVMNDQNGDGELGAFLNGVFSVIPRQFSNTIAHPQLGIDVDDNLYLSYSAMVDGDFVPASIEAETVEEGMTVTETQAYPQDSLLYYDVFMVKSTDKGATWQGPLNVTQSSTSEEAYPSIPRNINDTIFLVYQHDILPGIFLNANSTLQSFATLNEIAVTKILPRDINDVSTVFSGYTVPLNCNADRALFLRANTWGLDYPEGLIDNIQIEGMADYSTPGSYKEAIFVVDAAGNKSDTVEVNIEVIPDSEAPLMEIDGPCTEFTVVAGNENWVKPDVQIVDLVEFDGEAVASGCDISENLQIEDNVNVNEVGEYNLIYTVADFAGNPTSLEIMVEVIAEDTEGPELTVNGLPELINLFDFFNPNDVQITAIDKVDCENVIIEIEGLDKIDPDTLGEYPVTITATDQSGNPTIEEFTVTVKDAEAPTITLALSSTIDIADLSQCGDDGIFDMNDDPWVSAIDETDGDITNLVEAVYNDGDPIECACGTTNENEDFEVVYTVSDAAGNEATAVRQVRVICVGIEDNAIYEFVDIFPNPTNGQLFVKTTDLKVAEITVYNVIGKTILSTQKNQLKDIHQLDLSNQSEGLYMVNIVTDKGIITRKIHLLRN